MAILGDINPHLINAYEIIRLRPLDLFDELSKIEQTKPEYYRIRSMDPKTLNAFDQAVRFLYLNRLCYNGVYRTNRLGAFNVPFGSKLGRTPDSSTFLRASKALANAVLLASDFRDLLSQAKPGDFVYIDPPYRTSRQRGEFGPGSFTKDRECELVDLLNELTRRGVHYVLSYTGETHISTQSLVETRVEFVAVRRQVASSTTFRGSVNEMLIWNFAL